MTRIKLKRMFVVMSIMMSLLMTITVYAKTSSDLQTYVDNDEIHVFLPTISGGEIVTAKAQIGNLSNAEVTINPVLENYQIHTTILFDNSLSITEVNRENMRSVAKELIQNHQSGELFSIYTIDKELRELSVDSDSYEELIDLINGIEYVNQETYLKNVLYDAFNNASERENYYQRFIILSDGTDDNVVGYTYNDITRILDDKHYSVCAIGSRYEYKLADLEEMFSIARAAGSAYFLVDKDSDVNKIVSDINQSIPKYVASIQIPDVAKNGSSQKIKISIGTAEEEYMFTATADMPFQEIVESSDDVDKDEVITGETETVNDDMETEAAEPEVEKHMPIGIIIGLIVAIAIVVVMAVIIGKNKKRKAEKKKVIDVDSPDSSDDDDDSTMLMKADDEDEEDDDTILMVDEDDSTCIVKTIVLQADNKTDRFEFKCITDVTIGRKSSCDVQILGDKSVSGVHCIISCDAQGTPVIRDNNSSNGTYLNDEKLTGEKILEPGDTLEIGRTRYSVQIIG